METNSTEENYTNEDFNTAIYKINRVSNLVVLSGIFLLGTTGNGLVIWFVAFKMKKTVNSIWFLSLAVADFTLSLLLPITVTYRALDTYRPFDPLMCKIHCLVLYQNLSVSVLQLTIISIDRCISVVFPVWCQNHRTVRLAVKVVLAVWTVPLLLNVSYFIHTQLHVNNDLVICFIDWSMHKAQVITRFIVLFVAPFTIIILCYIVIFLRIQRIYGETSTKPVKVIVSVIISFFICCFPYHVFSLLNSQRSNPMYYNLGFAIFGDVSFSLACSNICVNPFLYVFIGKDFREDFWSAIKICI